MYDQPTIQINLLISLCTTDQLFFKSQRVDIDKCQNLCHMIENGVVPLEVMLKATIVCFDIYALPDMHNNLARLFNLYAILLSLS